MIDRELLELAAKAASIDVRLNERHPWGPTLERRVIPEPDEPFSKWLFWRPLADDGDALRLAAKLGINVAWKSNLISGGPGTVSAQLSGWHGIDPCEEVCISRDIAVRRAIVRVAAALGAAQ